jgi:hypothetical protein
VNAIEEGRAASKSPHKKGWLFSIFYMSQQAVSADIIPNSADI